MCNSYFVPFPSVGSYEYSIFGFFYCSAHLDMIIVFSSPGTMGRILELKSEMVNLEYSEFHYMDDVLSDLKLTPVGFINL